MLALISIINAAFSILKLAFAYFSVANKLSLWHSWNRTRVPYQNAEYDTRMLIRKMKNPYDCSVHIRLNRKKKCNLVMRCTICLKGIGNISWKKFNNTHRRRRGPPAEERQKFQKNVDFRLWGNRATSRTNVLYYFSIFSPLHYNCTIILTSLNRPSRVPPRF